MGSKKRESLLIFPHQLYEHIKKIVPVARTVPVFLLEAPRYFTAFAFHQQKLMLHRASMKAYQKYLDRYFDIVYYVEFHQWNTHIKKLKGYETVHYIDPVDVPFERSLRKVFAKINLVRYESPSFLLNDDEIARIFKNKKSFLMYSFYIQQRKRFNILLIKNNKPVGGKWSFDEENRQPVSDAVEIPSLKKARKNKYMREAEKYIKKYFSKNPGNFQEFWYPVTHTQSKKWLEDFLKYRFKDFGTYQDAIIDDQVVLFHSVLSPVLNIGLLTAHYVLDRVLAYAQKHKIPINSLEGFVRQLIGWREFVRAVYVLKGQKQRKSNFFRHRKKVPKAFWNATTDIEPVDMTIQKVLDRAYVHHIERLMILGNFMLLCGIHPNRVYQWFMELFIDAYDWVMIPNVYGMSQFADGGLMSSKPYVSSSRYIVSMSNYKNNDWSSIWDALYWNFLYKNRKKIASKPRGALMLSPLKKMSSAVLRQHKRRAHLFLKKIR